MSSPLRILVFDEEPLIGVVIRDALADAGHSVHAVGSEEEAIAALRDPFDMLFLHRRLPDSMCNDLVRLARQHTEPVIILLSSEKSLEAERNMLRLGAAEILFKPLDPLEIRGCVERHRETEAPPSEILGGPRILVVDDDQEVLYSVRDILDEHYEVIGTTSPYEALQLLRESPFEILLADLMMDELSGIDLIRAACNTRPLMQAIVMTGYASKQTAVAALKEGVADFLEKPLTPELVRQTIAQVWKSLRYQLENRNLLAALRIQLEERERLIVERDELITDLETKNSELERFAYTVSHDLRTPLVTIRGYVGMLWQDFNSGDRSRLERDIGHISSAVDTMNRLLEGLLELSKIGHVVNPPEDVALSELAREAINLVGQQLNERGIETDLSPDLPEIRGDRSRLLEVFQNLFENAAKYIGDQPSPRIEIGARERDGETVVFVRDNGIGIDPLYHEKVFGLFDRLDPSSEGSGLGLAVVKRIVELHGGRIWVESQGSGHGSNFSFTLPGVPAESAPE